MSYQQELSVYGQVETQVSLSKLTSFRIGGDADYVVQPRSIENLERLINYLNQKKIVYKILGNGSNILASDEPYHGVIIKLNDCCALLEFSSSTCTVGSAVSLIALAHKAAHLGLSGLEFASGIPGTVGGALYMNAGAYKSNIYALVEEIYIYRNHTFEWVHHSEISFKYRYSSFMDHPDWIILQTKLNLKRDSEDSIVKVMQERQSRRLATQPLNFPSAGSIFRNPEGHFAWELIQNSDLRGVSIGDAQVSEMHANYIINKGKAKATDVRALIEYVQQRVFERTDILLKPEVEFFNF